MAAVSDGRHTSDGVRANVVLLPGARCGSRTSCVLPCLIPLQPLRRVLCYSPPASGETEALSETLP
jgi:hypothetical protein